MIRNNRVFLDWPAPAAVQAFTTTRKGGVSAPPFNSWNLAAHVGDNPGDVAINRGLLGFALTPPRWLTQVHGDRVVQLPCSEANIEADACFTYECDVPCLVMTADCLPVFFANTAASVVGVAHAGWRGLAAGVIEATIAAMGVPANSLLAYLGPAIGPDAFQVGDDMREVFISERPADASAFIADGKGKWRADLYLLARHRLQRAGVTAIYGGAYCTYTQRDLFFSYRRSSKTGRMASVIWLAPTV